MKLLLILLFLIPSKTNAEENSSLVRIEFIGPCAKDPMLSVEIGRQKEANVGGETLRVLEDHSIPYIGSESGFNSIFETPTGLDALEVISDTEMRAYGWCFEIDGFSPALYPDDVLIGEHSKITWWFGYAHHLDGEWVSQCDYSYQIKPEFLCGEDDES